MRKSEKEGELIQLKLPKKAQREKKDSKHLSPHKIIYSIYAMLCLPSTSGRPNVLSLSRGNNNVVYSSFSSSLRKSRGREGIKASSASSKSSSARMRGTQKTFFTSSSSSLSSSSRKSFDTSMMGSSKSKKREDGIKTSFSASASGFFSAANNEVNNVKKLDQSVSLYEKLEREIELRTGNRYRFPTA